MTTVALVGFDDRDLEPSLVAAGFGTVKLATTSSAALAATSPAPDVVVIDMRHETSVPPAVQTLHRHQPDTRVVLVAQALDTATLLEAMRAGASEVLAATFTAAELTAAIHRLAPAADGPARVVVAFAGAKGGQGTTTIAVNVAVALAASARTLLVDLHQTGGHAALLFDARPAHSIVEALENPQRLDDAFLQGVVVPVAPNLDLLAAPESTERQVFAPAALRDVLRFVADRYPRLVIDLPAADRDALDLLDHLDRLVIVATQELPALRDAARLLVATRAHYGDRAVVVINRFDRRADITIADVERTLGTTVAHTFPSAYRRAQEAQNAGKPLVLESSGPLTDAFRHFAQQLVGPQETPPHAGLFDRLLHASV